MSQKLSLKPDGTMGPSRMFAFTTNKADTNPKRKLGRLQELLKSQSPKICVVRGEGIGDVLMITPALHALRGLYNGKAQITVATNTKYLNGALVKVLKGNPDIYNVIDRDNIDEPTYDAIINLHCPAISHEVPCAPPVNRIDLFARHCGFSTLADPLPRYFITKEELEWGADFVFNNGLTSRKIVMVNLFSSSDRRSIGDQKMKKALTDLYNQHKVRSLIVRHSSSDPSTEISWNDIPGSLILMDKDVRQLASIMVYCDLLLAPDSALLHLGGALGVPTVALFGPTDPRARINYFPNAVAIWEGRKLGGHPHWYEKCPFNDMCWKMITEEMITNACIDHLQKTRKPDLNSLLNRDKFPLVLTELI